VILGNGNIVVTDPDDSSVVDRNGAAHLYNPVTQALIGSIYGNQVRDELGNGGISVLGNDNYVIGSAFDDDGAIVDAGSICEMGQVSIHWAIAAA
jgi:hypothetical protein